MKNTKLILSLFALLLVHSLALSQSYFQQEVNYKIEVRLDDQAHELFGNETIEYVNNSAQELTFIYMHIWPNAYKNNHTALARQLFENGELKFYYSKDADRGYIDQLDFKVNGSSVKWEYDPKHADICKVILNEPLKSGNKIILTTPFHVKIPLGEFSRLGHIGQQYQITQWYPKPAVYDLEGWHPMPYLDQGEFYSEFGTFDVFLTLPSNYVVGATGDLVNGEQELEWLNKKAAQTDTTALFISSADFPPSDPETKTLHYRQSKVHDFAWFADKRYYVLKGEVELPHSKRTVTTWTMFTGANAKHWKKSIPYMNDAIYYYSLWNGDYPYNQATAVDGALSAGGGMEYPNVTVIGEVSSAFALETVIMHEVGHNWFYGVLGSNERIHPWMDEGINSFNENRYIETKYPDVKLIGGLANSRIGTLFDLRQYKHKSQYELLYQLTASKNEDQPIELPAYEYTPLNYGAIVYSKTALAFDYLMAYPGNETMDKAMQKYFETWKFKHPQPNDLRKIIEEIAGKPLPWFFDDMILTTKKLDYKISSYRRVGNNDYSILLKNTGNIKGPFSVSGIKDGKTVNTQWYEGFEGKQRINFAAGDYTSFRIDASGDMPELNRNNNILKTKGAFKRIEPLRLQLWSSLDNPQKTQVFFSPVIGWNNYNKTMLGIAIYNTLLPQPKFEYLLMPLFGFGNKDIAGSLNTGYNFYPKKVFQVIRPGLSVSRYAYELQPLELNFNKIAPELLFEFKKKKARSPITQTVRIRNVNLVKEINRYDLIVPDNIKDTISTGINELTYKLSYNRKVNPYSLSFNIQQSSDFIKSAIQANYQITFKGKNRGMDFRFFAGKFIDAPTPGSKNDYPFRLGGFSGYQDYLYDNIFLGRSEYKGILSQQFVEADGGFKVPAIFVGQTRDWITALNITSSLPFKIPVRIFADIGLTAKDGVVNQSFHYDAGLELEVVKGIFEIYFPLFMSKDIRDVIKLNNRKYLETVRFILNLNKLNPLYIVKNISLGS